MSDVATAATVHEHRDYTGSKIGMWLFLFSEVLLFGGLFLLYAAYRTKYTQDFHQAAKDLDLFKGSLNTLILLTSSLTMALSIAAIQKGQKQLSLFCLGVTTVFGALFICVKYSEWSAKFAHGIYPQSEHLIAKGQGQEMFYALYFSMTGLHALHILIGLSLIVWMIFFVAKRPHKLKRWDIFRDKGLHGGRLCLQNKQGEEVWSDSLDQSLKHVEVKFLYYASEKSVCRDDFVALENVGLYWHLVDVIWIFLFPLFYLIG